MTLAGQRITVVGGGVSGLSAALFAAERGATVELLDEAPALGGLLAAHPFRAVSCDLGSHRLHREALAHAGVARVLSGIALERRPRRGVLLLDGRRIPYPPTFVDVARGLGLSGFAFAASFLARPRRFRGWESARVDAHDDVGFADFVRARVGDGLYRSFYRPYVEKVWGLAADDVSQTVAKARVSTTSPLRLVGGKLLRALRAGRTGAREGEFLYPRAGMSSLVAYLAGRAREHGVSLRSGARFDLATSRHDAVLYAGRLRDLVSRPLEHRGVYLVYLALPLERVSQYETIYTPEARYWFGRVSELQNYSPALRTTGETILCVEIPEGRHGRERRFDEEPARSELLEQLRDAAIMPRGVEPVALEQRFVPDVYPLYRRGWTRTWEDALTDVARLGDVLPFGRQGLFLHCNIDQCIEMAHDVVAHVAQGADAAAWRTHARGLLGVRVRD